MATAETVKVVTRTRPLNSNELSRNSKGCLDHAINLNQITITHPNEHDNQKTFTFDIIFDSSHAQKEIYDKCAFSLIENVLVGYNGTIFAYGQTGTGKTHSMVGNPADEDLKGIIPRSFSHIISSVSSDSQKKFLIRVSFIEIYNEEIRDLLSKNPKAKKDLKECPDKGIFIKD